VAEGGKRGGKVELVGLGWSDGWKGWEGEGSSCYPITELGFSKNFS